MTTVTRIHYSRTRHVLELAFDDGSEGELSAEFLRVHSPSAEVRGHTPGQEVLQTGKRNVAITTINAVGHYAVQLVFDDGHDSGIFTWPYLLELVQDSAGLWERYLKAVQTARSSRDPEIQVLHFKP